MKSLKRLYAIRRVGFGGEIEYFSFCTEQWISERCFDNFCVCDEGLAKHYAQQPGIKDLVTFNVTIEEAEKEESEND